MCCHVMKAGDQLCNELPRVPRIGPVLPCLPLPCMGRETISMGRVTIHVTGGEAVCPFNQVHPTTP